MKYVGGVSKKEREDIFKLFLDATKLKFHEIEEALHLRSNHVAYHLGQMQKQGLLEKRGDYYFLTSSAERYLPIFPHITGKSLSPVPVVLVAAMYHGKILLIKRNNRPYKNYWSLIGGKMHMEETFSETTVRLVKQKTGIEIGDIAMNAVLQERVQGNDIIKHNFILFFMKTTAQSNKFKETPYGAPKWFQLKNIEKENIIPSDLWLIKHKLKAKADVKTAIMHEHEGTLSSFRIVPAQKS